MFLQERKIDLVMNCISLNEIVLVWIFSFYFLLFIYFFLKFFSINFIFIYFFNSSIYFTKILKKISGLGDELVHKDSNDGGDNPSPS